ncbi:MAG: hypothetical protein ACNS62_04285 [Candidatus Cyclobacteriaceae bacterium M3_2C_046]
MAEIQERVNTLEHALGSFIIQSEKAITSLSGEIKVFKDEMKVFKDEMLEFKDGMKVFKNEMLEFKDEMKVFKDEMLEFKDGMKVFKDEMLEFKDGMKVFKNEMFEFKDEMKVFKNEMLEFKDEMKAFKNEMLEFKNETRRESKQMNKRWGEISNKLGSIAEDIAAPGLFGIIKRYFQLDPDKRMDTLYIRHIKDRENIREFDAVAITDKFFFLCEIKATPRSDYVKEFVDLVSSDLIYNYFPEYKEKILVPVFSSLELPDNVIKKLSRHSILAMAMGEEHMEIINKHILNKWLD